MGTEGHEMKRRSRRIFASLRRHQDDLPDESSVPVQGEGGSDEASSDEGTVSGLSGRVGAMPTDEGAIPVPVDGPRVLNEPVLATEPEPSSGEANAAETAEQPGSDTARPGSGTGRVDATLVAPLVQEAEPTPLPEASVTSPDVPEIEEPIARSGEAVPIAVASEPADLANDADATPEPDQGAGSTEGEVPSGTAPSSTDDKTLETPVGDGAEEPAPPPTAPKRVFDEVLPIVLPRIIAIANQKGGVGKTTTAVNLGASLAELGFRVLVVDLDPQGNATTGLGINGRNVQASVYDVIMNDSPVEDCVEPTSLKNLFVVPATIDLAGAEIELVPAFSRELKLRRALEEVRDEYDFMLIDCPPSLGLLTVNGLAAADDVIVPIQCEYYALEGLGQLLRNVALVRTNLQPALEVRGIILTMYDARTKLAGQVEREVREHFGPKVYRTVVPRTVRLSEAPSFGQPIIVFDSTSRGAIAYRELAKEVSRGASRGTG